MRRSAITRNDINRWKGQGFGQGEGAAYKPWIDVRSFSSKGRVSRAPSITTGREHHLFSDNEDNFCLMADYAKNIVDIREQFPLLPEENTQRIAAHLGIRHPRYPNSGTPIVMTTDFLLTLADSRPKHSFLAVSIKSADDLRGPQRTRTLAKLEVERRYWLMRNVPWQMVTDEDFDQTLIASLDWLNYVTVDSGIAKQSLTSSVPSFLSAFRIVAKERLMLDQMVKICALSLGGISNEFAYQLFRYCAWHHLIELDLCARIGPQHAPRILAIVDPAEQQGHQGDIRGHEQRA
jgi:hypothetical protein